MMTFNGMIGMTGTTIVFRKLCVVSNTDKMMTIPTTPNEINNEIYYRMLVFEKFIHNRNDVVIYELYKVAKKLRLMLSVKQNPPVQQAVESGALFFLIQMFSVTTKEDDDNSNKTHNDTATSMTSQPTTNPPLFHAVTVALANISYAGHTDKIVNHPVAFIDKFAVLFVHKLDGVWVILPVIRMSTVICYYGMHKS